MKDPMKMASIKLKRHATSALYHLAATWRVGDRRIIIRWIVAMVTAVVLIVAAWCFTRIRQGSKAAAGEMVMPTVTMLLPPMPENIAAFYRSEISPLLDAALKRNREAADRAIALLHERFKAHRAGVTPFAEDVSSWGTKFGVIGRFSTDLWDRHCRGNPAADAVGNYIQEKFRTRVLSEQSLQADLEDVLRQYREDLTASRNQLFAEIKLPLHGSHWPLVLDETAWEKLCQGIGKRAQVLNQTTPRDSVVTGLVAVAGGWVGAEASEAIVGAILARVGTAVAVEAAETATVAGGSAMVGGSATGGGVGSFGGPAGTAIGVGVGLIIGGAIDWWMSDRLEAHVTDECGKFLDTLESQIVDGSDQAPGLRASFEQAAKLADAQQRQAIIDALMEARK